MVTYLQLAAEPVWGAQFTPPVMNAGLLGPLRVFFGLGPSAVGAAGDNNHLYGRHRSYDWDRVSRYCTDRSYGTTDARDQGGNRNWYRAIDVGITGQTLFDASRRVDALTRSGKCPGIAEWFGTFNGSTVVGWFEGQPSTADSSHLFHLHVGVWNSFADDAATMQQLYGAITVTAVQEEDVPKMFRVIDGPNAGLIGISNGPWWYHIPGGPPDDPGVFVRAATGLWGITDGEIVDIHAAWLDGMGQQTFPKPTSSGGGGGLVPHTHSVPAHTVPTTTTSGANPA